MKEEGIDESDIVLVGLQKYAEIGRYVLQELRGKIMLLRGSEAKMDGPGLSPQTLSMNP
jgi:hypothetical protein